jgi:ligand-binding SRPBCC domain-containing protein
VSYPRVVHEHREPAEPFDNRRHGSLNRAAIADIGGASRHAVTRRGGGPQRRQRRVDLRLMSPGDVDLVALAEQGFRSGVSNAACRAGYKGSLHALILRRIGVMPLFEQNVFINAPVEAVFAFHERPDALELLSPPFPPLTVLHRTGGILTGAEVHLRIGPIRWDARHTAYERNRLFIDEQVRGPFVRWVHRHEFHAEGSGTLLIDRIEFAIPGGTRLNTLAAAVVRLGLRRMFTHRHAVTRRHCEGQT